MKNNHPAGDQSSQGWNSDEKALGDLSCEQAARLATGFIGSIRVLLNAKQDGGPIGMARMMAQVLNHQCDIVEQSAKDGSNTNASAIESLNIGVIALCLGAMISSEKARMEALASFATVALDASKELSELQGGFTGREAIVFNIRKHPTKDGIEIGVDTEDMVDSHEKIKNSPIGKTISKVLDSNPPKFGVKADNEFGQN